MEKKTKIILFTGLAVTTTIGLLYLKSRMNQKQGEALLEALNKSFTENDISKGGDEAIKAIGGVKLDNNKIAIGKFYGNIKDKNVSAAFDKAYSDLHVAMKGMGTNQDKFYSAFFQIRNKNTMAYIDKMMKVQFGESLFEAMKGELYLNNSVYGKYSDKTQSIGSAIPFYNSYWNPTIAKYLALLPDYTQLK